jgi:hypothetical protein
VHIGVLSAACSVVVIQLEPAGAGSCDARLGIVQKEFQGGAAREAVAGAVVRIDPIDRSVGLDN